MVPRSAVMAVMPTDVVTHNEATLPLGLSS